MKEHKNAEWMIATLDRRRKSPRKKVELLEPVPETVVYKRRAPLKLLCSTPKQEKMNSSSETRENKSVINHLISFLCCSAFIGCVSSVRPHSYDFMLSSHCNAFKSLLLLFRWISEHHQDPLGSPSLTRDLWQSTSEYQTNHIELEQNKHRMATQYGTQILYTRSRTTIKVSLLQQSDRNENL